MASMPLCCDRMKAIVVLLFLAAPLVAQEPPPAAPATILAVGGEIAWGVGVNGRAVGWALARAHHHVTVAARLGNGGGHAYVDAYLMRKIGPEATEEDEVAHTTFDLTYPSEGWVTLFDDLDLDRGVYWLIVAKPREKMTSSINWIVARPLTLDGSCDVRYMGTKAYTFFGDAAEYIPASKFESKIEPYGFQIALTEPVAEECR